MCLIEDWRYQFTLANNICFLELIKVVIGQLDELQKAEKYPFNPVVIDRFHCLRLRSSVRGNMLKVYNMINLCRYIKTCPDIYKYNTCI